MTRESFANPFNILRHAIIFDKRHLKFLYLGVIDPSLVFQFFWVCINFPFHQLFKFMQKTQKGTAWTYNLIGLFVFLFVRLYYIQYKSSHFLITYVKPIMKHVSDVKFIKYIYTHFLMNVQ